jgi:hypothetical protein
MSNPSHLLLILAFACTDNDGRQLHVESNEKPGQVPLSKEV